jgi:guanine nucleotide-binding protein subunit alpha
MLEEQGEHVQDSRSEVGSVDSGINVQAQSV